MPYPAIPSRRAKENGANCAGASTMLQWDSGIELRSVCFSWVHLPVTKHMVVSRDSHEQPVWKQLPGRLLTREAHGLRSFEFDETIARSSRAAISSIHTGHQVSATISPRFGFEVSTDKAQVNWSLSEALGPAGQCRVNVHMESNRGKFTTTNESSNYPRLNM